MTADEARDIAWLGAWITGTRQHMLDPGDPWLRGYRLTDTWGARVADPPPAEVFGPQ